MVNSSPMLLRSREIGPGPFPPHPHSPSPLGNGVCFFHGRPYCFCGMWSCIDVLVLASFSSYRHLASSGELFTQGSVGDHPSQMRGVPGTWDNRYDYGEQAESTQESNLVPGFGGWAGGGRRS